MFRLPHLLCNKYGWVSTNIWTSADMPPFRFNQLTILNYAYKPAIQPQHMAPLPALRWLFD